MQTGSKKSVRLIAIFLIVSAIAVVIVATTHRNRIRSKYVPDESSAVLSPVKDTGEFVPERVSTQSTAEDKELQNPFVSLKSNFTWKKTLFNKVAISGYIRNTASHTRFGNIQARLEVLDENYNIVATKGIRIPETLLPGDSVKVHLKSDDRFRRLKHVRLTITSANPQRI